VNRWSVTLPRDENGDKSAVTSFINSISFPRVKPAGLVFTLQSLVLAREFYLPGNNH
jgi:hypothetical protein